VRGGVVVVLWVVGCGLWCCDLRGGGLGLWFEEWYVNLPVERQRTR
jgi:hypothetical protein